MEEKMNTFYSVEVATNQKINELRKEAKLNRLTQQVSKRRTSKNSISRFLSSMFRRTGIQLDGLQTRT
jgi:hypothetical protein